MPIFFPIYCCIIWYNCASSLEDIIVKFQKCATRLILDPDFKTPSEEHFAKLKWQTFPENIIYVIKCYISNSNSNVENSN